MAFEVITYVKFLTLYKDNKVKFFIGFQDISEFAKLQGSGQSKL